MSAIGGKADMLWSSLTTFLRSSRSTVAFASWRWSAKRCGGWPFLEAARRRANEEPWGSVVDQYISCLDAPMSASKAEVTRAQWTSALAKSWPR